VGAASVAGVVVDPAAGWDAGVAVGAGFGLEAGLEVEVCFVASIPVFPAGRVGWEGDPLGAPVVACAGRVTGVEVASIALVPLLFLAAAVVDVLAFSFAASRASPFSLADLAGFAPGSVPLMPCLDVASAAGAAGVEPSSPTKAAASPPRRRSAATAPARAAQPRGNLTRLGARDR
jgi:hypothetical protein